MPKCSEKKGRQTQDLLHCTLHITIFFERDGWETSRQKAIFSCFANGRYIVPLLYLPLTLLLFLSLSLRFLRLSPSDGYIDVSRHAIECRCLSDLSFGLFFISFFAAGFILQVYIYITLKAHITQQVLKECFTYVYVYRCRNKTTNRRDSPPLNESDIQRKLAL